MAGGAAVPMQQEPLDRAALIEAASRSLRQQLPRRDRPRSKGSLNEGEGGLHYDGDYDGVRGLQEGMEPRSAETAQRRIRSAENQHRVVTEHRDGPHIAQPFLQMQGPSASALERYAPEDEVEEDAPSYHGNLPQEDIKRPLSRKKDPSASAAAGLGAFAGPSRMVDAFEQRRAKQPIPVDSWGPRPPSRAGPPQKVSQDGGLGLGLGIDGEGKILHGPTAASRGSRSESGPASSVGRPTSRASGDQLLLSKASAGGTRPSPSAWTEPRGLSSEARRGRERKAATRTPEAQTGFRSPQGGPVRAAGQWASVVRAAGAPEEGAPPRSESPAGQTPATSLPTRKGRQHSLTEAVSVEDLEPDGDLGLYGSGLHGNYRLDSSPAQVIVTRSSQQAKVQRESRRGSEQRGSRERNQPFDTSLDADFLSLFAS